MKKFSILMMVAIFCLAMVSCGGDDGDDNTAKDTVQSGEDTVPGQDTVPGEDTLIPGEDTVPGQDTVPGEDTVGVDTVPGEDTVLPDEDTVVEPAGACTNEADLPIIAADRDGITAKATDCGLACLSDADPVACATPCVVEKTGLTNDCAGCYAGMINCTIANCIAQCALDPASETCKQCQTEAGCYSGFYACSGLTPEEE